MEDEAMLGIGIIVVFMVAVFIITRRGPADRSTWVTVARQLRLTPREDGLAGTYRNVPVDASAVGTRTVFVVGPVEQIHEELMVRGAGGYAELESATRVMTGDATFDRRIVVLGPYGVVVALMDWETRQRIATMVRDLDLEITDRTLKASLRGTDHNASLVAGELAALVNLARRLRLREEVVAERYYDNAGEDPKPQVRRRNLEALLERHPTKAITREALRRARTDPDARVRAVGE